VEDVQVLGRRRSPGGCGGNSDGGSDAGIIHFLNGTPIDWFAKRQTQVETATFGSEFVSARTATEQLIDLRYTLRMLGVPIEREAYLFGDNESVVKNATIPHSQLAKRWNALSYHRVREAIAAGWLVFKHLLGRFNVSDCLTKNLSAVELTAFVEILMKHQGDPLLYLYEQEPEKKDGA